MKCAKLEFVIFLTTNFQKYLAKNFFWVHFFPNISTDLKSQRKILRIYYIHLSKKNIAPWRMLLRHSLRNLQFAIALLRNWQLGP